MLYQKRIVLMKSRMGSGVGANCATASSIPSRKVRMRILTLTSQASQFRSSKVDCIAKAQVSKFQCFKVSKFRCFKVSKPSTLRLETLKPSHFKTCFYPASFAIMANSGMYSEITIPPILTPSRPMMAGSSMASMSLVAASTSSS